MKERFQGDGIHHLIESLLRQEFVGGNRQIVDAVIRLGKLEEFRPGERLIMEGESDSDIFLLLAGSISGIVKENEIFSRHAGEHVGEMAAIEPSQPRSATIVAQGTVVAWKISSNDFAKIGVEFPQIWLPIARILAKRLFERNKLINLPNASPKLFIISSAEGLPIANEIQSGLQHDVLPTVWTNGVFFAGGYPLEHLETAVAASDFAVAVAQADDIVKSRGKRLRALRDNVLFELGLFMGRLGRHRSFLLVPRTEKLKLPSDLCGLTVISYSVNEDADLSVRLGPPCTEIRKAVKRLGVLKL